MGDKILASPNLEITYQNLKIIKYRLKGIKKHLPELRQYARENKQGFKKEIEKRCNMWTNLLLDLKNPSDCLPMAKKVRNKIIILVAYYYLLAIPLVLIIYFELHTKLGNIPKALISGLIPIVIFFYWWVIQFIKDRLIVSSFKFKISQFQVRSDDKQDEKEFVFGIQ